MIWIARKQAAVNRPRRVVLIGISARHPRMTRSGQGELLQNAKLGKLRQERFRVRTSLVRRPSLQDNDHNKSPKTLESGIRLELGGEAWWMKGHSGRPIWSLLQ